MNWLDKLEKKWYNKGITNITRFLILANLMGTVLMYMAAMGGKDNAAEIFVELLAFDGSSICHGQIWRLFTWMFMPQFGLNFLELLFVLCLLMLGSSLERYVGTFRMNMYYLMGWFLTTVGALAIYGITFWAFGKGSSPYLSPYNLFFSLYLMLGIFLPDAEMRLYFVLPIKMKWLVIVYAIGIAYEIYSDFRVSLDNGLIYSSCTIFAVINLLYFCYCCKNRLSLKGAVKQKRRQHTYQQQFSQPRPGSNISHHKCAICGRTELDDPSLSFRFCSKCTGGKEYCQEHLFTHTHF